MFTSLECISDNDCNDQMQCAGGSCISPCSALAPCGDGSSCQATDHSGSCVGRKFLKRALNNALSLFA